MSSRMVAPLLSLRGPALAAGLALVFFPAFFDLPPTAVFRALGATFLPLPCFFELPFSGPTAGPCAAVAAALSLISAFIVMFFSSSFCPFREHLIDPSGRPIKQG